ncbi:MAG: hypothetical protein SGJ21_05505 [Alphaproteobacteria bacterium]|nr:hypothetical protein [Alphaproteobacteria bacterium]
MRSMLCIMAFAIAPPPRRRADTKKEVASPAEKSCGDAPSGPSGSGAETVSSETDDPRTWRVSFPVLQIAPRSRRPRIVRKTEPAPRFHDAMAIARRCEALLRVLNDPEPFARRLALRLARLAEPPAFEPRSERVRRPYIQGRNQPLHDPKWKHPGPCPHALRLAERRRWELARLYWSPG